MKQITIILTYILSFGLLSCVQSTQLADPGLTAIAVDEPTIFPSPTEEATPTINPNVTPTLIAKKQAALEQALAALGDKANNMRVSRVKARRLDIGYTVRLQQTYHGIPVYGADTIVFTEQDQISKINETYYENISLPSITPTITLDEDIIIAVDLLGVGNKYILDSRHELMIKSVPTLSKNRKFILVWIFGIDTRCPEGLWGFTVNATTGAILSFSRHTDPDVPAPGPCPTPLPIPRPTPVP